jgi:hypothetical protein
VAFRRYSPIVSASVCELLLVAAIAAACGGAGSGGAVSPLDIPFIDHGTTQQSANDDGPKVVVANDPGQTGLGQLVTSAQTGRTYIAVFAGAKPTGGFAVEVESVTRDGDRIVVHARFAEPPADAFVIQVLTSPAHLVSIERQQISGVREAVLVDQQGAEVARSTVPQSQP